MKTILHICDWYRPLGGAERLLFDSLELLEQQGHSNIVAYNDHPDQLPSGNRPEYPCRGMESWEYHNPYCIFLAKRSIRAIDEIIARHRPDLCHIRGCQNSYLIEHLIQRLPCVRSVHDPRLYCFTQWKLLPDKQICHFPLGSDCLDQGCLSAGLRPRNHLERNVPWVMRNLEVHRAMPQLIAESRAQIDCLLSNGFPSDQIAWLPNFTPTDSEEATARFVAERFDPNEKLLLFVGRASSEKGIHVLLEACHHIQSRCKIVLITAGPLLEQIQAQAAKHAGRVEVIPGLPYEQTREYYARASAVIIPSVWMENFCLVGLEAFANMKPVIGSRAGGIQDWLKEPETGWFFEMGNPVDLAQKIDHALSDPARLQTMGLAAYRRVRNFYTADLYLERLLKIYETGIRRFQEQQRS